jgi:hypothetical protein
MQGNVAWCSTTPLEFLATPARTRIIAPDFQLRSNIGVRRVLCPGVYGSTVGGRGLLTTRIRKMLVAAGKPYGHGMQNVLFELRGHRLLRPMGIDFRCHQRNHEELSLFLAREEFFPTVPRQTGTRHEALRPFTARHFPASASNTKGK